MSKQLSPLPPEPFVSIIIPFHWGLKPENYKRFVKEFRNFLNLDYKKYEILLVVDRKANIPYKDKKIRFLITNSDHATSPAEKRDFALPYARGEVCVFIDDDAYPRRDWIRKAVRHFQHPLIVAVGGPGVTPPLDNFWQKVGGAILESKYCSGQLLYRYHPTPNWLSVDDYPAYNLFIRTDILKRVGGFNSTFYYGEDTRVCIELIKHGKILYDPEVVAFHHRRVFPKHHLIQIWRTGVHRGFFVKAFPQTSKRWIYFLPLLATIGLLLLAILAIYNANVFLIPLLLLFSLVWSIASYSILQRGKDFNTSFFGGFGVILTHIAYALGFIKGLSLRRLVR